jgi:predicted helicase
MDEVIFPPNNDRVAHQKILDIRVIIANPPYSAGQSSQNDANANLRYPTLDAAIELTYVARSNASSSRTSYDSYIRAIRWATDRLGSEGVICYGLYILPAGHAARRSCE